MRPVAPVLWVGDLDGIAQALIGEPWPAETGMDFHVEPDPNDLEDPDDE